MNPRTKKISVIIGVIVLLGLAYFYFQGGSSATSDSLLQTNGAVGVGSAELALLNQMKSIRIDTTLFSDPAYVSLVDNSVAITPEAVGRPNPFAPIPGVADPNASEPASGITTPSAPVIPAAVPSGQAPR